MLTSKQFDKWIEELRDEENEQGTRQLASHHADDSVSYCCLGLLSEKVLGIDLDERANLDWMDTFDTDTWGSMAGTTDAPPKLEAAVDFVSRVELAQMNDGGSTFSEIADHLEACREEYVDE